MKVKIDSGVDVKISGFERYTSITVDVFLVGIHRVVPLDSPASAKTHIGGPAIFPLFVGLENCLWRGQSSQEGDP